MIEKQERIWEDVSCFATGSNVSKYYIEVTWSLWRLRSQQNRLFVQQRSHTNCKENIKAPFITSSKCHSLRRNNVRMPSWSFLISLCANRVPTVMFEITTHDFCVKIWLSMLSFEKYVMSTRTTWTVVYIKLSPSLMRKFFQHKKWDLWLISINI